MGDFYLLSGKLTDAMVWYVYLLVQFRLSRLNRLVGRYAEAIAMFKAPGDYAWHAAALEGYAVAMVLDAWAQGDGLVSTNPDNYSHPGSESNKLSLTEYLYFCDHRPRTMGRHP